MFLETNSNFSRKQIKNGNYSLNRTAVNSGVNIITTVHGRDICDIKEKISDVYSVFDTAVIMTPEKEVKEVICLN